MSQTSDDIITAIARFSNSFRALDLKAPQAILLQDHESGMRFMQHLLQKDPVIYTPGQWGVPVEHPDGSTWMKIELYGVEIRWPARLWTLPKGGQVYG